MAEPQQGSDAKPTRNPAGAVHGTVLAGALIAAQGAHEPVDISRLITLVFLAQILYWLAHVYAELVGRRVLARTRLRGREMRHLLAEEWPLVGASFGPLAVVALADLLGAGGDAAVLAGLWATTAILVGWTVLAGLRSRLRLLELLLYVSISAGLGISLVVLKVLVH